MVAQEKLFNCYKITHRLRIDHEQNVYVCFIDYEKSFDKSNWVMTPGIHRH